ncbi:protein SAAL1 isoform X2 [Protobothrops mucrosquamatus]|uniref:protein SAAL1 isoform X2 n=1 Tax=Protobothrops mucrosquamatus TaxID=103944 RepID=UPI000775D136|nr:protein SAAL1 isoform X2 [Protobothrops mucrosquamatus]
MDRNPSPPSSDSEEEEVAAGNSIGNTVYSKHWLISVLEKLIEDTSKLNNEEEQMELDEEMENDICKVWDMSMDKDVALFLQEFKAPDIFMVFLAKSKCPRLTEICVGILGNMACCQDICISVSKDENLGQIVLHRLCDSDSPTLLETSRLLLTCLCQSEVANIWVERIRQSPSVYNCFCFIMSSSTNEQPTDDSPDDVPDFKILPCLLEAAKQVCSDNNSEGLEVYMHILQLLTTVDEGIQTIVKSSDRGKETWSLLYNLFCNELCQPDDPPIIVQEQKTLLASILSVLSAIFPSQTDQDYVKMGKNLVLIDSVIRVLQNMDECEKRSVDSLKKSQTKECEKLEIVDEDFHLKILKDICCELLSNMLQELSEENILEGLKQGHINEQKCSCAFQNLLPFYSSSVESFLEVLHGADQTLADNLIKCFPSLKLQA